MNQVNCVSLEAEINSELHKSLQKYLNHHPYWDVNQVINASLSLFMLQNWSQDRGIDTKNYDICSKVYLDCIFHEHRNHLRYEENN